MAYYRIFVHFVLVLIKSDISDLFSKRIFVLLRLIFFNAKILYILIFW